MRSWILHVAVVTLLGCDPSPSMTIKSTPHPAAAGGEVEGAARSRGCGPPDRPSATVLTGEEIEIAFDRPLGGQAIDQYWMALVPAPAPEGDIGARIFLDRGATTARLRATAPGDYEIRLHGRYPAKEHHLLARIPVKVQGWPVKAAWDAGPR